MTTRNRSLLFALLALSAITTGCTQMGAESSMKKKITAEPDASFMKRVKNDPFPSAGQQAAVTANSKPAASATSTPQAIASDESADTTAKDGASKDTASKNTAPKSSPQTVANRSRNGNRTAAASTSTKNN